MTQIIAPLKNVRLVVLALLANFVLVPLLAYLIILIISLEQSLAVGLAVLATAAGASFLPKLVQGASGGRRQRGRFSLSHTAFPPPVTSPAVETISRTRRRWLGGPPGASVTAENVVHTPPPLRCGRPLW
jgi:hypothetical protein